MDKIFASIALAIPRARCIQLTQVSNVFCSHPEFFDLGMKLVPWGHVAIRSDSSQPTLDVKTRHSSRLTTFDDFFSTDSQAVDIIFCKFTSVRDLAENLARVSIIVVSFSPREYRESTLALPGFTECSVIDCVGSGFGFRVYVRDHPLFDVVIPVGPNDIETINLTINSVKKYVAGYRNIYTVSRLRNGYGNMWIDESKYSVDLDMIAAFGIPRNRTGWYLQQLLKLDFQTIEPRVTENYLVVDADTVFKRPIDFLDNEGRSLLTVATEYHLPYFDHMKKLIPWLSRATRHSGVAHHMMFTAPILTELKRLVSMYSNENWVTAFLKSVDSRSYGAGASEYEIYFNLAIALHPDKIRLRELHWNDQYCDIKKNLNSTQCVDFFSNHWHIRRSDGNPALGKR